MRNTLMTGIGLLALPAMMVSAPAVAADEGSAETVPPAPQGPFYSSTMAQNAAGFPPMGFDPMNPAGAQAAPPVVPGPGQVMNNATGGGLGGGNEVDIQIRGRIQLNGKGAGNQGWGGNNAWQSMPYGMPYNHGYGAPYGTPFMQSYGAPQARPQAPAAVPAPAPEAPSTPNAEAPAQQPTATPSEPFSWAPKQGMNGPGGFYAQPQMPAAPQAQPQMPQQNAPVQPQMPTEPDWVKQQRAEAEKRQQEAQKRFEDMQKNNPYAQHNQGQAGGWGQPQSFNRGFGMPFQHGYGGPYGAPFMGQPYGAPQPQAPAESGSAEQ